MALALAFQGYILLLFDIVRAIGDAPKPHEVIAATTAPDAESEPRSTAADAPPVGAESDFVHLVDMIQWLAGEKPILPYPGLHASSLIKNQGVGHFHFELPGLAVDLRGTARPPGDRAATARCDPSRSK